MALHPAFFLFTENFMKVLAGFGMTVCRQTLWLRVLLVFFVSSSSYGQAILRTAFSCNLLVVPLSPHLLDHESQSNVRRARFQVHHMLHNTSGGSETAESSSESDAITRSKSSKGRASFPRRKTKRLVGCLLFQWKKKFFKLAPRLTLVGHRSTGRSVSYYWGIGH